jgi:hypothetical protein
VTLTAASIIEQARSEHPAFTPQLVPVSIACRFVNEGQRRLMKQIHRVEATYLSRIWSVMLIPGQDVAQVGAATGIGAPLVMGTTALERRRVNTGSMATVDGNASILVNEMAATGGSTLTLTTTGTGWAVDAYMGQAVELLSGTGAGQVRQVMSNTADTIVLPSDTPWDIVPDATTTFVIRTIMSEVDGSVGVMLGSQPNTRDENAFLVKLDAQGRPYLDLATPVTVPVSLGIPLPPSQGILDGMVFRQQPSEYPAPSQVLSIIPWNARQTPPQQYCAAVLGQQLYLCAPYQQWSDVTRIEIPYIPLPPAISRAEDYVFLPDDSEDALVAAVVLGMARRALSLGAAGMDIGDVAARASQAEADYLDLVTGAGRAISDRITEVF